MIKGKIKNIAEYGRKRRHYRIRKKVFGTAQRPRLVVHRSHKNLYVQLIDDVSGITLLSLSTNDRAFKKDCQWGGNKEAAKKLGTYVAEEAKKKGLQQVVFDRGGYLYHGRIKALADSAREAGLKF